MKLPLQLTVLSATKCRDFLCHFSCSLMVSRHFVCRSPFICHNQVHHFFYVSTLLDYFDPKDYSKPLGDDRSRCPRTSCVWDTVGNEESMVNDFCIKMRARRVSAPPPGASCNGVTRRLVVDKRCGTHKRGGPL